MTHSRYRHSARLGFYILARFSQNRVCKLTQAMSASEVNSGLSYLFVHLAGLVLIAHACRKYIEAKRSPVRLNRSPCLFRSFDVGSISIQLNAIPTVGYPGILTSYITAIQWIWRASELLQEGYDRVCKISVISPQRSTASL